MNANYHVQNNRKSLCKTRHIYNNNYIDYKFCFMMKKVDTTLKAQ